MYVHIKFTRCRVIFIRASTTLLNSKQHSAKAASSLTSVPVHRYIRMYIYMYICIYIRGLHLYMYTAYGSHSLCLPEQLHILRCCGIWFAWFTTNMVCEFTESDTVPRVRHRHHFYLILQLTYCCCYSCYLLLSTISHFAALSQHNAVVVAPDMYYVHNVVVAVGFCFHAYLPCRSFPPTFRVSSLQHSSLNPVKGARLKILEVGLTSFARVCALRACVCMYVHMCIFVCTCKNVRLFVFVSMCMCLFCWLGDF